MDPLHLQGPFSCMLQMPTGSGKTWHARQEVERVLKTGGRAIYVTPLRALATEVCSSWQEELTEFQVGVFTGDFGNGKRTLPVSFKGADLLVMTPERLDACTRMWRSHWEWIPKIDLVVVDEIHLLGDRGRGPRMEGAISRFRRLNPFARFIGLTATIGNTVEVANWLDGVALVSESRPVPLEWRIVRYRKASDKSELLVREVQRNVADGGGSLVFVQSRRRAEELSRLLLTNGLAAKHHHAGLNYDQRRQTENGFRNGETKVLVATSTLEMGLNLPARQVVLYDLQGFNGNSFQALTTNTVWQRVGRAGRPGLDTSGEAVLIAAAWDKTADSYPLGRFERIESGLRDERSLSEQILTEVGSGMARTRHQTKSVLRQSLGAGQGNLPDINALIDTMCEAKLLTERGDESTQQKLKLYPTRLGRVVVRHMLSPQTVLTMRRMSEQDIEATFFDLLLTVAATNECEPVIAVDFEELDSLAAEVSRFPSSLLAMETNVLAELFGITPRRLLSAIKMAAVARQWTISGNADEVAESLSCYPFEVNRLADSMHRLLLAFGQVIQSDEPVEDDAVVPEAEVSDRVKCLGHMVRYGINEEAVTLTFLPGVGGKLAQRMSAAGISDIEELAMSEAADFQNISGVSAARAQKWISEAEVLVKDQHALWLREIQKTSTVNATSDWPKNVDPYRLRRALELVVDIKRPGNFVVTGGLEPHRVEMKKRRLVCDCMDYSRGHLCKHILTVRLNRKDTNLVKLVRRLSRDCVQEGTDLFQLWFSSEHSHRRATA